jgi:hypothetical protein
MKRHARARTAAPMSAEAYAGFLKLYLTPSSKLPRPTPEVKAYLRHVEQREPLSETARRALGLPTDNAA